MQNSTVNNKKFSKKTMKSANVFVALGSNLGDSKNILNAAFSALAAMPKTALIQQSSIFQSAPIGYANQNDFLNAVAFLKTELSPLDCLKNLQKIEQDFGRERLFLNAPRTLDLDLLLFDDCILKTSALTIPHPRLHLRAFVLRPLLEIAPDLEIPNRGRAAAWIPAVAMQKIRLLNA